MPASESLLNRVDHLVYAAPDLESAIEGLERRLGVRAAPGGEHPGRGTRNALIALGPATYLEFLAPDPAQPEPAGGRWLGVDSPRLPRLTAWAAKSTALDRCVAEAAQRGVRLGAVRSGSRRRPDGVALSWQFTDPATVLADGLAPFFIDWGASPHPAATAPGGASLVDFRAEHPAADRVRELLLCVGVDLPVEQGSRPALIATVQTALGRVEIR
jgi:hypothetical protein